MDIAPYGVAYAIRIPILKVDDTDFAASGDYTPTAADVLITKDGGDVAAATDAPTWVGGAGSRLLEVTLTTTEMEAAEIAIQIVDAAGGPNVEHQAARILTYGNVSAAIPGDFDLLSNLDAAISTVVAGEGAPGSVTF